MSTPPNLSAPKTHIPLFDADEPNYAYMRDGKKLLTELGQLGAEPVTDTVTPSASSTVPAAHLAKPPTKSTSAPTTS
jgi:hypothetical protein